MVIVRGALAFLGSSTRADSTEGKNTYPLVAKKGFGRDHLAEVQKIIDAEKSDLFDVLAYVA